MSNRCKTKPLVVLAGWLGCQPRSLQRYERFFETHGYQVLSRIATPHMVVECCFQKVPPPALKCPTNWPMEYGNIQRTSSMQDFAWDILREVNDRKCDYWAFYAFSNGGCFVWEQVRRILSQKHSLKNDQQDAVENLQEGLVGAIFDSCPSQNLAGIGHALAFCSESERTEVVQSYGRDVASPSALSPEKRKRADMRSDDYYNGLLDDPSNIPQLYLYSESDKLIPSHDVDALFEHRRELLGSNRVFRRKFGTSRHCAHLIDNSEEYAATVETFLEVCRPKSAPSAKL